MRSSSENGEHKIVKRVKTESIKKESEDDELKNEVLKSGDEAVAEVVDKMRPLNARYILRAVVHSVFSTI